MAQLWPLTSPVNRSNNKMARRVYQKDANLKNAVCSQHEYESGIVPLAAHFRWPKTSDMEVLITRLKQRSVWERVKLVYRDPGEGIMLGKAEERKAHSRRFADLKVRILACRHRIDNAG